MWSGPRNLSTAMMRSFGARPDCAVWDEPFFAPFLKQSGKEHPGREETLAAHETDPQKVANSCVMPAPCGAPYYFLPRLCAALEIPWDAAMLSWEAGPRESDGAWAPYWYASVERSTGFGAPPDHLPEVAPQFSAIFDACMADYSALAARRLSA